MTTATHLESWVPVGFGSDFPIQNLPYGVFADAEGERCGVAIGEVIVDLARAEAAGLFTSTGLRHGTFRQNSLNTFLGHSRGVWSAVRGRVTEMLTAGNEQGIAFARAHNVMIDHPVRLRLPVTIGDYVDFYSSQQHAINVGRMFRPDGDPLLPNWKRLPVGYHGRAGTIIPSGTPIKRPHGQMRGPTGPLFGASEKLDIELEVGFITGAGPQLGTPIPVDEAEHHIFGMCLVNDWSARDIQAWEYVPLGPFLGKSFATSISPWIVPLEALEPFRVSGTAQDPVPLPYLQEQKRQGVAIDLTVDLSPVGSPPTTIIATSFTNMYWTMAQQLAHATINGATTRPGDLYASGTVSGPTPDQFGSLLEQSWNGTRDLTLSDGSTRTYLEDGDTIRISARCDIEGAVPIGFGECKGTVAG
ncbi:MAG: fumarylacetoacetase [Actinomycetia bacterium]|nr:fumarylacetoacetase [Actinomycetes bacterium]